MPNDSVTREILANIDSLSKLIFYALATASMVCFAYGVFRRVRLWRSGRKSSEQIDWRAICRRFIKSVIVQRKVRRGRKSAGMAHGLLFGGFGVLFIGTVLIAIEHYSATLVGREATNPLFHKGLYFTIYEFVLDTAGIALLVGCGWFLMRRWQGKSSIGRQALDWWVLGILVLLGVTGYLTEGLRIIREQTPLAGFSYVGLVSARLFELLGMTRGRADAVHFGLWWTHTILALSFIAAIPYTRLLHAIAGLINLSTSEPEFGSMVPISIEEVEETGLVGVAAIENFTWRTLLTLDACVSCGRCEDACPAHRAGKPLSPRDIVQDLRRNLESSGQRGTATPSLQEQIANETVWSCTTCHACVDVCPLGVNPMELLTDLRRNRIAEGQMRGAPATSLQKMQRSGNPWGLPVEERLNWADGLVVPQVRDHPDFEVLYWVGCAAAYDRRIQKVARAVVQLLQAAEVNFAVLGPEERCTGESARRMGDEFLFQELATSNLETLSRYSVRKIVTHCPHCLNSLKQDYPQFGGRFEVVHHTEFLAELIDEGKLVLNKMTPNLSDKLTYHDPCYLARVNGVTQSPRDLIQLALPSSQPVEMPRHGLDTACCGAGGGRMWFDDSPDERVGIDRVAEAIETGAGTLAVSCPFCLTMMTDGTAAQNANVVVKDVAELLLDSLVVEYEKVDE